MTSTRQSFLNPLKQLFNQRKENIQKELKAEGSDYFKMADTWFYERYSAQLVTAYRWQLAFWVQLVLSVALVIGLSSVLPLKTWEPIVIEKDLRTGEFFVKPTHILPKTDEFVESDLVRYVIARETYAAVDEVDRYRQVIFSSTPSVGNAYKAFIDPQDEKSIASILGRKGLRTVKVEDVVFLSTPHKPGEEEIAKLDFVTTEADGQTVTERHWVATVSWEYLGTPHTKAAAWMNWNGFTVLSYRVDQRNL